MNLCKQQGDCVLATTVPDVRTYSVKEELNAYYNHAISAGSGRSLLLRVNETEYQSVLDVISVLCGSQPTYQLRDVKAGEQQPYVCNWSAESLSLHVAMVHEQTAPSTFTNLHQRMRSGVQVFDRQHFLNGYASCCLQIPSHWIHHSPPSKGAYFFWGGFTFCTSARNLTLRDFAP